jgi:ATP-dependent DNA ligase
MPLAVPLSLEPMEAEPVDDLPAGPGWHYEPKWDGFRCLVFRDGKQFHLQSRNGKPLARFFPELEAALLALPAKRFVLDGELVIAGQPFDALQMRLHPAASRIEKLSREMPASVIAFDLLVDAKGRALLARPLAERRAKLEDFFRAIGPRPSLRPSPCTASRDEALGWLTRKNHGLDGIVAKRRDESYRPGERAMKKYKLWQTVDCVIGGVYLKRGGSKIESLLLGLYDKAGLLHYVGRARLGADSAANTRAIVKRVKPLMGRGGFTGRAPGGISRWSKRLDPRGERKTVPMKPVLVAEVSADRIENERFRHGARLLRFRDDKVPERCTIDQLGG